MYTRILIPLDGSKTAEKVLPYARALAGRLKIPIELLSVIDIVALGTRMSGDDSPFLGNLIEDRIRSSEAYLKALAAGFPGLHVKCTVEKGRAEDVIIDKGASDTTLTAMATHGRSGINRWLLGSVTEKVLRGARNPLFLVRAGEDAKREGETVLKSVIVPLDGSELAERVLATVIELAKALELEVVLLRAYNIRDELRDEARTYLEKKTDEVKRTGIEKVTFAALEGHAADEIIGLGRKTADNLIAMCTHGRSGVKRWVLGSVTETVVRHSGDPVLVIRAT